MPAPRMKSHVLTSVLLAMMVLSVSPPGHSADKAPWVGETLDGKKCVGKRMGFGPYDYLRRAQLQAELDVVEGAHFTPEVERLEAGVTSDAINDIAYTIGAWPNHHRALYSAVRFRMTVREWPEDAQVPPAECQLQRAIAFSPNDPVPYMMFGMLLHKARKYEEALALYQVANRLRPDDVLTQYNMGLTLVELKQYKEAVQAAKSAYAAGIPLPGLKNKLIAAGQWPGAAKPAAAAKAAPDVQVKQQATKPEEKNSGAKVLKNDNVKTTPNSTPKPTTAPKSTPAPAPKSTPAPAPKPAPKTTSTPEDKTEAPTKDQTKATKPLANSGKPGIETPEVSQ